MNDHEITCAECGAQMMLRDSKYGKFFGCSQYPNCKGTHGAHPDGSPLGIPADAETKLLRRQAHIVAESIWNWNDRRQIKQMYDWLKRHAPKEHIGQMDKEDLVTTISLMKQLKKEIKG